MHWTRKTLTLAGVALAALALLIGAGAAVAAGDDDAEELTAMAERLRAKDAFADAVAAKLGTTAAALQAAIEKAAVARIDAAEQAGSLSAADADLLRETVADGGRMALRIAQGADVAQALGVTEAELDAAWAAAHKANALARIDEALKADRITKTVADELKQRIEQAELPGFGEGGRGMHGRGFGHHGGGLGPMGDGLGRHGGGPGPLGSGFAPGADGSGLAPTGDALPAVFA